VQSSYRQRLLDETELRMRESVSGGEGGGEGTVGQI
jgi:hypothetical protein